MSAFPCPNLLSSSACCIGETVTLPFRHKTSRCLTPFTVALTARSRSRSPLAHGSSLPAIQGPRRVPQSPQGVPAPVTLTGALAPAPLHRSLQVTPSSWHQLLPKAPAMDLAGAPMTGAMFHERATSSGYNCSSWPPPVAAVAAMSPPLSWPPQPDAIRQEQASLRAIVVDACFAQINALRTESSRRRPVPKPG
jgi:hypothetical protein